MVLNNLFHIRREGGNPPSMGTALHVRNGSFSKFCLHPELENPYQNFLKFYTLKEAICDIGKCWDELPLSIIDQSFNNLLKRNLLKEELAQDFEGFVGEQSRVDFGPQIKNNERMLAKEVQELVSIFNGLAHDTDCGVPRKSICTTNDKFIIDDLEVRNDLTQPPDDLLDELVDNLVIDLHPEDMDLVKDLEELFSL